MTLRDFFEAASAQPVYIVFFFVMIIVVALLTGVLAKGEGEESPWKYLYSTILYLVCVPGIFAITLQIYLFLFERRSVFDMNLLLEILPIFSMVATILIVRRNVDMDRIPGFDKLSGLVMMIFSALAIMWFIDKTRIIIFSYMPIQTVLLIFAGLLLAIRLGWSRLIKG
jgi:phosphoglycerol transferase MdoB-like AlkP superfamily enzyme